MQDANRLAYNVFSPNKTFKIKAYMLPKVEILALR